MDIADLIAPEGVVVNLRAATKKQALSELAKRAAQLTGVADTAIFTALNDREALGSTGFGAGIAIPHSKVKGIDRMRGLFARLERPIDFAAIDGQPVDLLCLLLAPVGGNADHLKALARVSRLLRDPETCTRLRGAANASALYAALTESAAKVGCEP